MLAYPLQKLIHLRKDTPDGITAIYVNTTLRTLALSLIGIFLPVFVFVQTQDVFGKGIVIGLYGVVVYFLLWRLTILALLIPASRVLSKLGFRWSFLISVLFLAIFLFMLSLAENNFWIIPIAALVHGAQTAFYWLSYRTLFVKDGILGHLGEEVSTNAVLGQVVAIGGPVLGGLTIATWGFPALFIVALVVTIFSGVPFFFMEHHKRNESATLSSVVRWLKEKEHRNEEISFIGRNIEGFTHGIFWSIFMFLIVGAYEKQGLVASLGLLSGLIMTYIAGKIFDKKHSFLVFRLGVVSTAIAYLLRGLVNSFGRLLSIQIVHNTLSPFYWVTFDSLLYERAREEDGQVLTFMISRMITVSVALFLLLGFVAVVAFFEWRFMAIWIFASMGTIFSMFMWEKKKPYEGKK